MCGDPTGGASVVLEKVRKQKYGRTWKPEEEGCQGQLQPKLVVEGGENGGRIACRREEDAVPCAFVLESHAFPCSQGALPRVPQGSLCISCLFPFVLAEKEMESGWP